MKHYETKSLVMGILAIILCWFMIGLIFSILGIVFSIKGIKHGVKNKIKLYVGMILSILSIVLFIIMISIFPSTTTVQNTTPIPIEKQETSVNIQKDNENNQDETKSIEEHISNQNTSIEEASTDNQSKTGKETLQPNTSAIVDYIASKAKESANQSVTEGKRNAAISFIYKNYPHYFTDNKTIEKMMYYGYYLEYAYAKNGDTNIYANLGMDSYQSVKDVYRNAETVIMLYQILIRLLNN